MSFDEAACSVCADEKTHECQRHHEVFDMSCASALCDRRACRDQHGKRHHSDGMPGGNEDERNARRDDAACERRRDDV